MIGMPWFLGYMNEAHQPQNFESLIPMMASWQLIEHYFKKDVLQQRLEKTKFDKGWVDRVHL